MTTTPVLRLPDFSKPFIIEADASGKGLEAVLMRECRPLAFMSKTLCPKNQGLSIYEREFLAVLMAIQYTEMEVLLARPQVYCPNRPTSPQVLT